MQGFIRDRLERERSRGGRADERARGQDFTQKSQTAARCGRPLHGRSTGIATDDPGAYRILICRTDGSIRGPMAFWSTITGQAEGAACSSRQVHPARWSCIGLPQDLSFDVRAKASGNVRDGRWQSDVSIYTIDPRGLDGEFGRSGRKRPSGQALDAIARGAFDGARYLAEESGGFARRQHQQPHGRRSIASSAKTPRTTCSVTTRRTAKPTVKLRRNEVRLSRRGMQVVHRGGYLEPRASDARKVRPRRQAPARPSLEQLRELEQRPAAGQRDAASRGRRAVSVGGRPIACGGRGRDAERHAQADRRRWPLPAHGWAVDRPLRSRWQARRQRRSEHRAELAARGRAEDNRAAACASSRRSRCRPAPIG